MKRFLVFAAVTLLLASALSDEASAQRRGFGGGAGMRIGSGAFHGGGLGVGGAGFRAAGLGFAARPGWGAVGRPGWGGVVGRPGWRPGWGVAGRPGWWRPAWARAGWGWGFPLAVGLGLGYYGYPYSSYSDCLSWDGYRWVNICYQSYSYGYW